MRPRNFVKVENPRTALVGLKVPRAHRKSLRLEAQEDAHHERPGSTVSELLWLILNGVYPRTYAQIVKRWPPEALAG